LVRVYFPVDSEERDALLHGRFEDFRELVGQDRIEWDNSGTYSDAVWVFAEVPDDLAGSYEDPDSNVLGWRPFVLPQAVLRTLNYTAVPDEEVAASASEDPAFEDR
jgi:hypothetical protein